jgi:hypothetical protein
VLFVRHWMLRWDSERVGYCSAAILDGTDHFIAIVDIKSRSPRIASDDPILKRDSTVQCSLDRLDFAFVLAITPNPGRHLCGKVGPILTSIIGTFRSNSSCHLSIPFGSN